MTKAALVAGFAGLLLLACSGSSTSSGGTGGTAGAGTGDYTYFDAQSFCDTYVNTCKGSGTVASCLETARAVRVSKTCADGVKTASCDQLLGKAGDGGAALNDLCFPTCKDKGTSVCENDSQAVDVCGDDGRLKVFDCTKSCAATGVTTGEPNYTGTCSTVYKGFLRNQPICWCVQ
jgi:hypothetical protein